MTASTEVLSVDSRRKHHSWWLIVLLLVCIPGVMVASAFSDTLTQVLPETLPTPSSYNRKATGYSALFDVAARAGLKPVRWEAPYRLLISDKHKGTLVIVLPWEILGKGDVDFITKWVEDGNDLIYLDYFTYHAGQRLLDKLSLHAVATPLVKEKMYALDDKQLESAFSSDLAVTSEIVLTGGNTIVGTDKGGFLTVKRVGKGRCLIGSLPDMCSNKHIAEPAFKNNFQFMINWLSTSKQPIMFDEKCHGYSSGSNVMLFVLKSPVGFVLLQLALLGLVAFLSLNQRFGRPQTVAVLRHISNLEFIDGLASTYQRAQARDAAWAMMFHPLKAKLCKRLGIAPDAPEEDLATAWAESSGKSRTDCHNFLLRAQGALDREAMSEQELVELVAIADDLTADTRDLLPAGRFSGA